MQITKEQIKIIHTLKSALRLDDETYRAVLGAFRVTTSKDLAYLAAEELIVLLKGRAIGEEVWRPAQKRWSDVGPRDGMASPAQLRKIEAMWMYVSNRPTDKEKRASLHRFLENRFRISRLEWLPQHYVGRVIRVLEIMIQQERNKANVPDIQQADGPAGAGRGGPSKLGDSGRLLGPGEQPAHGEPCECNAAGGD